MVFIGLGFTKSGYKSVKLYERLQKLCSEWSRFVGRTVHCNYSTVLRKKKQYTRYIINKRIDVPAAVTSVAHHKGVS